MSFTNVGSIAISGNLITGNTSTVYNIYGSDRSTIQSVLPIPPSDQEVAGTREPRPSPHLYSTSFDDLFTANLSANTAPSLTEPSRYSFPTPPVEWEHPLNPLYQQSSSPTQLLSSLGSSLDLCRLTPDYQAERTDSPGAIFRNEVPTHTTGPPTMGSSRRVSPAFPYLGETRHGSEQNRYNTYSPTPVRVASDQPRPQQSVPPQLKQSPLLHIPRPQPASPIYTGYPSTRGSCFIAMPQPHHQGMETWPLDDGDLSIEDSTYQEHWQTLFPHSNSLYPAPQDHIWYGSPSEAHVTLSRSSS